MKIGVLTSSRADYGIYLPLLQKLKYDSSIILEIIAFGTHLSRIHGYTVKNIINDGFNVIHEIETFDRDDSQKGISKSYGNTIIKFSEFWKKNSFDIVFCLGDRYEMSAAVQATIPFRTILAHIHGGETTLGAIDNIFRHQITLASKFHFTSTEIHKNKVKSIIESNENVFNVGALSLNDIKSFKPVPRKFFYKKFNIPDNDFVLVTFHPETKVVDKNSYFANEMKTALKQILNSLNIIITMPNADTLGSVYRKKIQELKKEYLDRIILIENFGKKNYFSAMHYSRIILGNSSSGIIEAASFGKFVINVGDRQKGRSISKNVINADFNASDIIKKFNKSLNFSHYTGKNIYYKPDSVNSIYNFIKKFDVI